MVSNPADILSKRLRPRDTSPAAVVRYQHFASRLQPSLHTQYIDISIHRTEPSTDTIVPPVTLCKIKVSKADITVRNRNHLTATGNHMPYGPQCHLPPGSGDSYNLLQHIHWLPIKHRINFKIANITFRTLQSSQPVYLRSILHTHHSTRSIRKKEIKKESAMI